MCATFRAILRSDSDRGNVLLLRIACEMSDRPSWAGSLFRATYSYDPAMTGLLGLLLVSVSVGLSNFAGAIGIGLSGIDARTRLRVGIAFGLFEALMPIIGLLLGQAVAGYLGGIAKYVAGAILILTGAYTIWQGRRVTKEQAAPPGLQTHRLIVMALALSIDNLAV